MQSLPEILWSVMKVLHYFSVVSTTVSESIKDNQEGSTARFSAPEVFKENREFLWVAGLCVVMLVVRFLLLGYPTLIDPSETRFASAAQKMVVDGNYVTPMIHTPEGWIPYWAKPPLHLWLSAASFLVGGFTTAAARFPGFLSILLCTGFAAVLGTLIGSRSVGLLAALAYLSCVGVFIFSAVSLTDPTLALCVASAYLFSYLALFSADEPKKKVAWYRTACVCLGLGFLVKGPVALALFGTGVGLWLALSGRWYELRSVPWRSGIALFCACWLPWYVAAEIATPGFIRYFFLQENILRFLSSSEEGIRYGTLHKQIRGAIWVMMAGVAFPWSFVFIPRLLRKEQGRTAWRIARGDERVLFLGCWAFAPAVFFTAARQVLPTYTFSGLPALAVLVGMALSAIIARRDREGVRSPGIARLAGMLGTLGLVGGLYAALVGGVAMSASILVVALGLFVVLASNRFRYDRAAVLIPVAMVGAITFYSGIVVGLSGHLAKRRSTAAILAAVSSDNKDARSEARLAVVSSAPHSIIFFAPSVVPTIPIVSWGSNLSGAVSAGANRFIIQESDLHLISDRDLARLDLRASIGRWRYFRFAASPGSVPPQ